MHVLTILLYCTSHCCFLFQFRVAQAYVNQRKLDHEVKTLQVQASQFSKQTAQWISMVEGFNQALKVGHTVSARNSFKTRHFLHVMCPESH